MDKIRVGIIRCDTHGAWFGAMMGSHDPLRLRSPIEPGMKRKKTWQGGKVYCCYYTSYHQPTVMTAPFVEGFEITRLWDEDRDLAANLSSVFDSKPHVCDTFDEASDDVDLVFIADCNQIGNDHREQAKPGIEKGVPTFVDKPFAYDLNDATAIVDEARSRGVPILSLSILRVLPYVSRFAQRLPEVGDLEFGTVNGGGIAMSGHIHAISLAQHLFGAGGVESVEAMGQRELAHVHLNYREDLRCPRHGVMLNCDSGKANLSSFYASAYGQSGAIHSGGFNAFQFPAGTEVILDLCKRMVESRQPPVPYAEMLENIAVATAAREAQRTGTLVRLEDIGFDAASHA